MTMTRQAVTRDPHGRAERQMSSGAALFLSLAPRWVPKKRARSGACSDASSGTTVEKPKEP